MLGALQRLLQIAQAGTRVSADGASTEEQLRTHLRLTSAALEATTRALIEIDDVPEQHPARLGFVATHAMKSAAPIDFAVHQVTRLRLLEERLE